MESLFKQIEDNIFFKIEAISPLVSHTCQGIDIKTCDPNKKLNFR